ncbi:hypothetical protein H1I13_004420, partial [Salmonella enterica]|nr:hypothetical protein [Salmonella enterica]EFP4632550.1 hypothetical protein [Salmonella enterica]
MNEPSKGNIWLEKNIPALEYCRLPRATELLGCNISDLLHWAEIEAIELCLKIDWMPVSIDFDRAEDHNASIWFNEQLNNGSDCIIPIVKFSEVSIFHPSIIMADPKNSELTYHLSSGDIGYNILKNKDNSICGYAEGLWNFFIHGINDEFYLALLSNGYITIDFFDLGINATDTDKELDIYLRPCSFDEHHFFEDTEEPNDWINKNILPKTITITTNDIFITR